MATQRSKHMKRWRAERCRDGAHRGLVRWDALACDVRKARHAHIPKPAVPDDWSSSITAPGGCWRPLGEPSGRGLACHAAIRGGCVDEVLVVFDEPVQRDGSAFHA